MNTTKYDRLQIFLLSAIAILIIVVSIGCLQSNKSKIVGSWKYQSIDNVDGRVQYTLFKFYKEGGLAKNTGIIIGDQLSKPIDKRIGKYKFEDDKNVISINWDDGNSEKMNVSFPQNNKMILGKYEMEKTK